MCLSREGRFPSGGQHQRPLPSGNSPLPVMCGVTALSCGRWCPMERDRTGTWATRMWVTMTFSCCKHMSVDLQVLWAHTEDYVCLSVGPSESSSDFQRDILDLGLFCCLYLLIADVGATLCLCSTFYHLVYSPIPPPRATDTHKGRGRTDFFFSFYGCCYL